MIDLIQVQDDLYGMLMSAPQLATVNIVEERKFIVNSMLEVDAIWQTVRNGCSGNGLLIEIPDVLCDSDGVTGPPQAVELSFVSFQNGDAAFTPATPIPGTTNATIAGGGLFAEQIEQFLLDIVHLLNIGGIGTMQAKGRFSGPARDYPGINARRTKIMMTPKQTAQTARVSLPIISVLGGVPPQATITCATAGVSLYYTTDGSFPSNPTIAVDPLANVPINAKSTLYAGPFAVQAGQVIRAAAYLAGMNVSPIAKYQN